VDDIENNRLENEDTSAGRCSMKTLCPRTAVVLVGLVPVASGGLGATLRGDIRHAGSPVTASTTRPRCPWSGA